MKAVGGLLALLAAAASGASVGSGPAACKCPSNPVFSIDTVTVISSPGFNTNQICSNLQCVYRIFANNAQHVMINFTTFETFGKLTIYNGPKGDDSEVILATLRGQVDASTIPSIYSSVPKDGSGGVVTMVYQSTASLSDVRPIREDTQFGFQATFTTTSDNGCGPSQITQSTFGPPITIQTPNYPYNYPPDIKCVWNFTAPQGKLAQMSFQPDAHTEQNYDLLVVKNRDGTEVEYSGVYGTGAAPGQFANISGSGNGFDISFVSDDEVIYNGFKATLSGYQPPDQCDCGQTVYYLLDPASSITITSPNYGAGHSGYCENADCTYNLIVQDQAYKAKITFVQFDLETGYDHLVINDGINGFQLEDCTGNTCNARTSDDNRLTLRFITDASIGKTGFKAIFSAQL